MSDTLKYTNVEHGGVAVSMYEGSYSVGHLRNSYQSLSLVTEIFERDCRFSEQLLSMNLPACRRSF
jgi:hypothetical protein